MRTNYVLIDLESVQPESLALLAQDCFKVLIFVGAHQTKLPFELAAAIQRMGDKGQYIKISGTGPNALDFHIAFYIGQLASQDSTAYFHIISHDKGFDPLIQHLKSRKIFAARSSDIRDIPLVKASNTTSTEERAYLFIEKLQQPKMTRPRTESTLKSAVLSFYQKKLSDQEIASILEAMQTTGFISVVNGKVTYSASNQTVPRSDTSQ